MTLEDEMYLVLNKYLSHKSMSEFVSGLVDSKAFFAGNVWLDELFYSLKFKELEESEQLQILDLFNKHEARYSDQVYVEAATVT